MFMGLYRDNIFIVQNSRIDAGTLQKTALPDQWFRNPVGFWYYDDSSETKNFKHSYPDFRLPLKKSKPITETKSLIGVFIDSVGDIYGFYDEFDCYSKIGDLDYCPEFRVSNHSTMFLDLFSPAPPINMPFTDYLKIQLAGISSSTYGLEYLTYYMISVDDFKKCLSYRETKNFDEINNLWQICTYAPSEPIFIPVESLPTLSFSALAHLK